MMKLKVLRFTLTCVMTLAAMFLVGCAQNPYAVEVESANRKSPTLPSQGTVQQQSKSQETAVIEKGGVANSRGTIGSPQSSSAPTLKSNLSSVFTPKPYPTKPAVLALMDRASASGHRGDFQSAEVSLERALRINPKNLKLYRLMAELKIQKREMGSAAEIARKGLSIAKGRAQLEEQRRLHALLEQMGQE